MTFNYNQLFIVGVVPVSENGYDMHMRAHIYTQLLLICILRHILSCGFFIDAHLNIRKYCLLGWNEICHLITIFVANILFVYKIKITKTIQNSQRHTVS